MDLSSKGRQEAQPSFWPSSFFSCTLHFSSGNLQATVLLPDWTWSVLNSESWTFPSLSECRCPCWLSLLPPRWFYWLMKSHCGDILKGHFIVTSHPWSFCSFLRCHSDSATHTLCLCLFYSISHTEKKNIIHACLFHITVNSQYFLDLEFYYATRDA